MAMFRNSMNVDYIQFKQNIQCLCPLGGAYCTYQVSVDMMPQEWIPDYCEVEKKLRSMAGKKYTIEDAVNAVFTYLLNEYAPRQMSVSIYCDDAVHFPVTVTKQL